MQVNSYQVFFQPKDHDRIPVYSETDVEEAIKRALGIYHNFPIPHQVSVLDNDSEIILILNKTFKNI